MRRPEKISHLFLYLVTSKQSGRFFFQFFVFFSEYSNFKTVLTFIQQQDNLVESLEEVHIFVAVILNLVEQDNLRLGIGSKGPKQSSVLKIRKK